MGEYAFDLFSVHMDGQISQLTYLNRYNPDVEVLNYSWSPDGQSIAMWLSRSQEEMDRGLAQLAVLDLASGITTDTCIQVKYKDLVQLYGSYRPMEPIWSPDGQMLVLHDLPSKRRERVYLVHLAEQYAVQIAENREPVGWLLRR